MSMVVGTLGVTNTGHIESGRIDSGKWYTVDRIIVKLSNGQRLTRYAVCVNGCWKTNQRMTLREARSEVARLREEAEQAKYFAMYI